MNDENPETPPPSLPPDPEKVSESSHALIKWCLILGILSLVAAPVAVLKLAAWKIRTDQDKRAAASEILEENAPQTFGGPFSLLSHDGVMVSEKSFSGKYLLILFGYTYCPDLCPTALQNVAEALDELGEDADKIQVLFVTVDPERDTAAKLKDYVESFHAQIMGLTGTSAQIAAMAKLFGVTYRKAEKVENQEYVMEHATQVFVMGPDSEPLASFDAEDDDSSTLAERLRGFWTPSAAR